ncbi:hypothetical protein GUJ93_ZPchr0007g4285 [Zizania palustris]|uniref:Uncharacterized protein n=1 Tax=Zizania palustris TaxID=103762 RepID=A0A8J5T5D8_ZIZPA|nr:hypothetical protein GUJ93_ZPchr0007g4285 [Zizania palustris]KAG8078997.1 hypothetical protein GUJ93_ZPchr0007g4285 [Zizania palustris]
MIKRKMLGFVHICKSLVMDDPSGINILEIEMMDKAQGFVAHSKFDILCYTEVRAELMNSNTEM